MVVFLTSYLTPDGIGLVAKDWAQKEESNNIVLDVVDLHIHRTGPGWWTLCMLDISLMYWGIFDPY